MFELVETIACMFYIIQKTMRTQERSSIAYRPDDFTFLQSLLYQRNDKFRFGCVPTIATDKH